LLKSLKIFYNLLGDKMEQKSAIATLVDEPEGQTLGTIVLAHGAGAGMDTPFLRDMAAALASRGFRAVRFEFPYMQARRETGKRSAPDPTGVLEKTWTAVVEELGDASKLVIGGRSMGGRIASMVADRLGVRGLVCMGYPFHPAGSPQTLRVAHLEKLKTPTLIIQGTRDSLGSEEEIAGYRLSPSIRLAFLPDGDHSFKPRKSSGRTEKDNFTQALEETVAFCASLL
jgi:predicted alpha/beta-hydrolase family hydrolase